VTNFQKFKLREMGEPLAKLERHAQFTCSDGTYFVVLPPGSPGDRGTPTPPILNQAMNILPSNTLLQSQNLTSNPREANTAPITQSELVGSDQAVYLPNFQFSAAARQLICDHFEQHGYPSPQSRPGSGQTDLSEPDLLKCSNASTGVAGGDQRECDLRFGNLRRIDDKVFSLCCNLKEIVIPSSLQSIGPSAFYGAPLTSIEIPDDGYGANCRSCFSQCLPLKKVVFLNSVDLIGPSAFSGARLKSVEIADGSRANCASCFSQCCHLEKTVIPSSVQYIDTSAFYRAPLTSIEITDGYRPTCAPGFGLPRPNNDAMQIAKRAAVIDRARAEMAAPQRSEADIAGPRLGRKAAGISVPVESDADGATVQAQMASLKAECEAAIARLANLQAERDAEVLTLKRAVAGLEAEVARLRADIVTVRSETADLAADLARLKTEIAGGVGAISNVLGIQQALFRSALDAASGRVRVAADADLSAFVGASRSSSAIVVASLRADPRAALRFDPGDPNSRGQVCPSENTSRGRMSERLSAILASFARQFRTAAESRASRIVQAVLIQVCPHGLVIGADRNRSDPTAARLLPWIMNGRIFRHAGVRTIQRKGLSGARVKCATSLHSVWKSFAQATTDELLKRLGRVAHSPSSPSCVAGRQCQMRQ
jgi:hypothetical protein